MKQIVFGREVVNFVDGINGGTYDPCCQGIGLQQDGKLIAGVKYDQYNRASVCMHVAAIGKRWMTREYLRVCFDYPFRQLGVRKILGLVSTSNLAAQRFDEHLGFVREALLVDAAPDGDLIIYSMTRQQCRFIGITHGIQRVKSSTT